MLDPQQIIKDAMSRLHDADKVDMVRKMLQDVAEFIDHHSIIVPELSINAGPVVISLSARRLPASEPSTGGSGIGWSPDKGITEVRGG